MLVNASQYCDNFSNALFFRHLIIRKKYNHQWVGGDGGSFLRKQISENQLWEKQFIMIMGWKEIAL